MFDRNGNWIPTPAYPPVASPGFDLGFTTPSAASTPFLSSLNNPQMSGDWALPTSLASSVAMPNIGMLDNINGASSASPGLMDSLKSAFSNQPWFSSVDSKTGMKNQGLFDMGLGAAQGLMGAYLGFQNLGIAKDTLNQNKRAFDLNFSAQRNLTNSRLADRQAARVAANPTAYASVADYMKTNGI
jgi:hypothetical protein